MKACVFTWGCFVITLFVIVKSFQARNNDKKVMTSILLLGSQIKPIFVITCLSLLQAWKPCYNDKKVMTKISLFGLPKGRMPVFTYLSLLQAWRPCSTDEKVMPSFLPCDYVTSPWPCPCRRPSGPCSSAPTPRTRS